MTMTKREYIQNALSLAKQAKQEMYYRQFLAQDLDSIIAYLEMYLRESE